MLSAWRQLVEAYGEDLSVAVRSSATAEDLPTASFAGQHDTYLNVRGEEMVLDAIRRCNASLFTDRAISYRIDKGFDHFQVALSAGVQKMVRSDLAAAGVIFSIDTETGFQDAVFITGAFGLGENVVQGAVDADEFYVHKATFRQGSRAVLRRTLGAKKVKMVYAEGRTREPTRNKPTSQEERERFCLTDAQVLTLADYALKIEHHYSPARRPPDAHGHRVGPGRSRRRAVHRPGAARDRRARSARRRSLEQYHVDRPGRGPGRGPRGRHQIAAGRARIDHGSAICRSSAPARSWSRTPRPPTGSR